MHRETIPILRRARTPTEKDEAFEQLVEAAGRLGWNVALFPPIDSPHDPAEGVHGLVFGTGAYCDEIEFALYVGLSVMRRHEPQQ